MSQYPHSPYSTPQPFQPGYAYDPYGAHLAPARRAGLLMVIIGSLLAAYGMCNAISTIIVPADLLMARLHLADNEMAPQWSIQTMRTLGVIFSTLVAIAGIAHIAIGIPVRRASHAAIISGIVLTGILGAFVLLFMLMCAVGGLAAPILFAGICALCIPAGILVLQLIWLIQARQSNANLQTMQRQYQQHYWQYQQQQQAYGYGYPQPPANQQAPSIPPPTQGAGDGTSTQG